MKGWWLILVVGCSSGTSARLTVQYDPSWQLDQFEVGADGERRSMMVSSTIHVLLPDSWAGKPLPIDLWGMRNQDRFAYGTTTITPVRGKEVTGEIVMSRVPCGAWCTPGATSCGGDGVATCVEQDSDSCFVLTNPSPCPAAAPYCSNGACAATCVDECVTGALRCAGPGAVEGCGQNDSDSCNDWLQPSPCPQGQVCSNGVCGTMCQDECTAGDSQCSGDGAITCGDFDGNGCTEWGPIVPCDCMNGSCVMMSSPSPSPCVGVTCDTPPSPSCTSTTTLRTFTGPGTCMSGSCQFPSTDTTCANGCAAGKCSATKLKAVSAGGDYYTCGIKMDDTLVCWGRNESGQATPPSGTFSSLSTGSSACALTMGGTLACWGDNSLGQTSPPSGTYSAVSMGNGFGCGIKKTDSSIVCWGDNTYGVHSVPVDSYLTIASGFKFACATNQNGVMKCWGSDTDGVVSSAPSGTFLWTTAGGFFACGIDNNAAASCWGTLQDGNSSLAAPSGMFGRVSAGFDEACGLTFSNAISCWGARVASPPSGTFTAVSVGDRHACALDPIGVAVCWGDNTYGQSTPP